MIVKEQELINSYVDWLKINISLKEVNGFYEISTPFGLLGYF